MKRVPAVYTALFSFVCVCMIICESIAINQCYAATQFPLDCMTALSVIDQNAVYQSDANVLVSHLCI